MSLTFKIFVKTTFVEEKSIFQEIVSCLNFLREIEAKISGKHDSHDDDCEGGRRLTPGGVHSRRRTGKTNFYVKSTFGRF